MTPVDFASRFLGEYKTKGAEIIPRYCPFCFGGDKRDRGTFALNTEKLTFNCRRGTCDKSGTFTQLCKDFGVEADRPARYEYRTPPPKKHYKPPVVIAQRPGNPVIEYLKRRGFSPATWEKYGVCEVNGKVAFPYHEGGKLVLVKYRYPRKTQPGEKKAWREPDGKPVFWGQDLCKPELPLTICEGEYDCLSLAEAGVPNAVSVPSGAEDLTCVELCWDWLQQFRKVIIWPDNDEPGQEMCRKLINRLGAWRCYVVQSIRKDANEVLFHDGKEAVRQAVENAVEVPIEGLIRLADVKAFDPETAIKVTSGITAIDRIFGGFLMGQTSIWTGISSSGKSTLLGQLMLEAVDQGFSVCVYSGELPAPLFRFWIDTQAAGGNYLEAKFDSIRNCETMKARRDVVSHIRDWYRDKFFLYDKLGGTLENNLLEVFKYAAQRYDCKVFLIDNLMTCMSSIATGSGDNFFQLQSKFVGDVIDFAHQYEAHVHLVAHPRKVYGRRMIRDDISGSGDISNRPDNILAVHRITDSERDKLEPGLQDCHNIVDIFKNRLTGGQDATIGLQFDYKSKRMYLPSNPTSLVKQFGWIKLLQPDLKLVVNSEKQQELWGEPVDDDFGIPF